jgi:hypothetical protein
MVARKVRPSRQMMVAVIASCFSLAVTGTNPVAQEVTAFPDIPRIDVHAHVGEDEALIQRYLELRETLREVHQVDLAMWVNLGNHDTPAPDLTRVERWSQGRMVSAISDYRPHTGLTFDPQELSQWSEKGYVGYKIWAGPWHRRLKSDEAGHRYVDDPAHEPTFRKMEELRMVGASIHIADPNGPFGNRGSWLADPVEYWTQINAWRNVLVRHPNLRVVVAHGNWLMCQDAQLDYLRYMLTTFPNLHIDLAATFQYYHLVDTSNLREFMIQWSDRILFGTDIGGIVTSHQRSLSNPSRNPKTAFVGSSSGRPRSRLMVACVLPLPGTTFAGTPASANALANARDCDAASGRSATCRIKKRRDALVLATCVMGDRLLWSASLWPNAAVYMPARSGPASFSWLGCHTRRYRPGCNP